MPDFIRILPPDEARREMEATERGHAAQRARRAAAAHDPLADPRTPGEALRAKFAGDPAGSEGQRRRVRPAADVVPARSRPAQPSPAGPRLGEQPGAAPLRGLQASEGRHRANTYESEHLNGLRHAGEPVELRLRGGEAIVGRLLNFDQYSLILEIDGRAAIVFKHAVDLIQAAR